MVSYQYQKDIPKQDCLLVLCFRKRVGGDNSYKKAALNTLHVVDLVNIL